MKKLLTILSVFLFQFSFSQSSDFVRPTVSFVVAPYDNGDDIGKITAESFAAFDLLKLQKGQLGISANPKKNKADDQQNFFDNLERQHIGDMVENSVFSEYKLMVLRLEPSVVKGIKINGFFNIKQGQQQREKMRNVHLRLFVTVIYLEMIYPFLLFN